MAGGRHVIDMDRRSIRVFNEMNGQATSRSGPIFSQSQEASPQSRRSGRGWKCPQAKSRHSTPVAAFNWSMKMRKETTTTTADAGPPSSSQDINDDGAATMAFLSEWNEEIVQFYVSRYQQYWSLPMQLQSCSSLDDLRALQQDFQATLFEEYRDEAARLSRVVNAACKHLAPEPASRLRNGAVEGAAGRGGDHRAGQGSGRANPGSARQQAEPARSGG